MYWETEKGMPYAEARIIGSSIFLLQRLLGKILQVCKNFSKCSLWKVLWRAAWVAFTPISRYLHKVNVSNCSFEDFFSFPCFLQAETRTTPLLTGCLGGIQWDESSENGSSLVAQADPRDSERFLFLGCGSHMNVFVPDLSLPAFEFLEGW